MKQPVRVVVVVIAVQAALAGAYWLVEHQRNPVSSEGATLSTAPPERVDAVMMPLALRGRDGSRVDFRTPARPTLVHFWATWCPPCRAEFPGLLALPDEYAVDVIAIALDDDWAQVDDFLDGLPSSNVLLGDQDKLETTLGVRTLPVTFLVQPSGRMSLRFDGARKWTDPGFLGTWVDGLDDGR